MCDSSSVREGASRISRYICIKKKKKTQCVCAACGETVPMGLAATKGYVGGEAQ